MKILLIGGYGMLGSAFPSDIDRIPRKHKDWFDIHEAIIYRKPDVVINCAGLVGHKVCEERPHEAYLKNVALPIEILFACKEINAKFIHFSTFYQGIENYTASKRSMDDLIGRVDNLQIVYLPTLFDKDTLPMPYDESFHVAYTKDVANHVLNNLDYRFSYFLCNEGYPTRKEFIEYVKEKQGNFEPVKTVPRLNYSVEKHYNLTNMRYWKEAVDEAWAF
jgi:dTDP-4-dehydrorhamnose reductase